MSKINTSAETSKIYKALFEVSGKVVSVTKNSINPHFRNKYANLEAVFSELRPALHDAGVLLMQHPTKSGLVTILIHAESGEYVESIYPIGLGGDAMAQAIGSAITYAKRYSLCAIFALSTDDDDGEAAAYIGLSQRKKITDLCDEMGVEISKVLAAAGVDSLAKIRVTAFDAIVRKLNLKKEKENG